MLALWLVCLLAGSSCAVFYTQSNTNDFPRMGRRSIFTASKDGVFPRIGRDSSSSATLSHDAAVSLYDTPASFHVVPHYHKRGIFTAGGPGFPRIGRRAQSANKRSRGSGELSPAVESPDVVERAEAVEEEAETRFEYPLGLMFFEFDKDGDKSLTREEFVQGMGRARQDGTLFR
ncbi:hypothetical protein ACOMHN_065239 [Nucella lapillus]